MGCIGYRGFRVCRVLGCIGYRVSWLFLGASEVTLGFWGFGV